MKTSVNVVNSYENLCECCELLEYFVMCIMLNQNRIFRAKIM